MNNPLPIYSSEELAAIEQSCMQSFSHRNFTVERGTIPLLISVPHGITHTRMGKVKPAERYTITLGKIIAEKIKCHFFYNLNSDIDPNFDEESAYREELTKYVRDNEICFVIDLHGAAFERDFDFELGTGNGKNIQQLDIIWKTFQYVLNSKDSNYTIHRDVLFAATNEHCVSSTVASVNHIPALQLEINNKLLCSNNAKQFDAIFRGLSAYLEALSIISADFSQYDVCRAVEGKFYQPINRVVIGKRRGVKGEYQEANIRNYPIRIIGLNGVSYEGVVYDSPDEYGDAIGLTSRYYYQTCEDTDVVFVSIPKMEKVRWIPPMIEKTKMSYVLLPSDLYQSWSDYEMVEVFNQFENTKADFYMAEYESSCPASAGKNVIWLSFYQRKLLRVEHPTTLTDSKWNSILNLLPESDKRVFLSSYDHNPSTESYSIKKIGDEDYRRLQLIFRQVLGNLLIRPIKIPDNEYRQSPILRLLINEKPLQLKICRCIETDENYEDVIKISSNNLKLLGLEETDRAYVRYRGKVIRARILSFDATEKKKIAHINNLPSEEDVEMIISMSAKSRTMLGITENNCCVFIERDMKYLFVKNIYMQFFAIIGVFIAAINLSFLPIWARLAIFVALLPVTIYSILGHERGKI